MNREIISEAIATLRFAFNSAVSNYNQQQVNAMIEVWYGILKDENPEVFKEAIKNIIEHNKYFPNISDIKREITIISNPDLKLNGNEEWEKVLELVRKCGYYNEDKALANMNQITRNIVRSIGYQRLCQSENIYIERKMFLEMFENKKYVIEHDEKKLIE